MPPFIGSVNGPRGPRRVRRRRADGTAAPSAGGPAEEAQAAEPAPPIPPGAPGPAHAAPVVSAQLMGQSDSAEGAAPAKSAARHAASAYLKVEWSGPHDRRTRRGRIAKTDV